MSKEKRMPKLWEALLTLAILIAALAVGIIIFGVDPHVPMFVGVMAAAIMALHLGYKWDEVEKSMMDGIYKALQSICILIIVGILIGVWINAGVVPTMIYYGLKVLKPAIFFIACVLICSITSLATGTSWGTMGTMGVALMGIGFGLGMSPGMTAGAVLSGAYFGDKMSPLSDTTNLAPAMAGTDVITHVKSMILPTGITYAIPLIERCTAAHDHTHPLFRTERKPPRIRAEHHRFYAGLLIPQGEIAMPAARVLHKICHLAAQCQIKQSVVCIKKRFDIAVQRRNRDHFSHKPASRAARMDTPMALSLEYCPGTKYT